MQHLWFPDSLREITMCAIVLRVVCCIICGGAVGIEREWRHRTAGFKTHILVCLGSCICMITGQFACAYFGLASIDPTRIGAQVVSGIGFLGVGTIIVTKDNKVKGLSTAAGLWVSACIGLAIGIGFYEIAVIATICVVALFLVVKHLKIFGLMNEGRKVLYLELEDISNVKDLSQLLQKHECSIFRFDVQQSKFGKYSIFLGIDGSEKDLVNIAEIIGEQSYVIGFIDMENIE